MTFRELQAALHKKSGFDVVDHTEGDNQLRFMGRQPKTNSGAMNNWLLVVRNLLQKSQAAEWKADISKQYFLRGDQVIYGWRVILQGEAIKERYTEIYQAIAGAPHTAAVEVTESPLPGASANRNVSNGTSRGATGCR